MARISTVLAACTFTASLGIVGGVIWYAPLHHFALQHGLMPMGGELSMPAEHDTASTPAAQDSTIYFCPMHPSYRSDKPGDCPICDMKLVPLGQGGAPEAERSAVEGHAAVTITTKRQQLIGVRTSRVDKRKVAKTIRAVGRVEIDERRLAAVNLKVAGWIEELYVKAVGETVKKGDPLLSVYSPELYEAQRGYLVAREALPAEDPTVQGTRERLRLLDLTDEQITALETKTEPDRRTKILSPVDGTVLQRNVVQGGAIEVGKDLFEIADLSTVWLIVDVYESEVPSVHVGDEAIVEMAGGTSEPAHGRVEYIYPTLNETARTARARIFLPNPEGYLEPGMYGSARIQVDLGEQLVIDGDAVLDTGTRKIVFVEPEDGRFEPREVELGDRSDGHAVVLKGLAEGDRIVTSGNFLVDSESRLQSAVRAGMQAMPGMEGMDMKDMPGMPGMKKEPEKQPPSGHEHH